MGDEFTMNKEQGETRNKHELPTSFDTAFETF